MDLKPGCEGFAKKIVPVLRARIAQSLANDYEMQQYEISKKLGVTQAAVSFYLGKERGANMAMIKKFPDIDKTAKKMAKALFDGKKDDALTELMCDLCHKLRKKRGFKSIVN
jgi:predicted transcriptional regulator